MKNRPLFSVIVPTFERPLPLGRCLQSLTVLEFPRDRFEVIVVDDGGQVDLAAVIDPFIARINIRLARQANSGPASARNYGASLANGRYLAFTDDDCQATPGWLTELFASLETEPNSLVGGKTVNGLTQNIYAVTSQLLIDYLYEYGHGSDSRSMRFFTSNNMAMWAENFHKVGGFNGQMSLAAGEDREFCARWFEKGFGMVFERQAIVYHMHVLNWRSFWQQHFNYGRGAYQYHLDRAKRRKASIKVEPFRFYWHLLRYPFVRENGRTALQQTVLLFVSQIANAAGFVVERMNIDHSKQA